MAQTQGRLRSEDAPVLADPNHLGTALVNLVVNARDAMPDGGTICVTARPSTRDGRPMVLVSVEDDGISMDAATLVRATEPFFTTKEVGKGTGLGLPMVHGPVSQPGGHMQIANRPGARTTVDLFLPVASAGPAPEPKREPVLSPALVPLTALAVDDDELVLAATVGMLKELGHRVTPVNSGAEALDRIGRRTDRPRCVRSSYGGPFRH